MESITGHTVSTYWIMKAIDNSVIHYGCVSVGAVVDSGQEVKETFTVEQDWLDRLSVLGITIEEGEY